MKTQKENIIDMILFIILFFRVFIIMYLKNALLDMCYFLIFGHIYIYIYLYHA